VLTSRDPSLSHRGDTWVHVQPRLVFSPPWTPDRLCEDARSAPEF